jgi:hypothetical protein
MGGMQYVYWMGARLTPWMLYCLQLLDADLQRLFGVSLVLHSKAGIRLYEEQKELFLSRYRLQASGGGPFGDVRWWQGRRYVRHSGDGTVAPPSQSNHEIQGTTAAVDVADSGGAGIGTMGSARSNWLRKNAENYGLDPEGFGFGEAWHYAIPNIFNAVPGAPAGGAGSSKPRPKVDEVQEDEMPDSMFAIVDGVPSWCWLNWGTGAVFAVHTQEEATWVGSYMGSVRQDLRSAVVNGKQVADGGGDLYKNKLALFGILCPKATIERGSLSDEDFARLEQMISAGVKVALAGAKA